MVRLECKATSRLLTLGEKRNQIPTNLEMLIARDTCSGASTKNQYFSFVIVKFDFVEVHPSLYMFNTPLCLPDGGTNVSENVCS